MRYDALKFLRQFWQKRQKYYQKNYKRVVPFGDLVTDRWEKARLLGFGAGSSIYDSALVLGEVKVGENTWIGPGVVLDGSGGALNIGSYCSISAGAHIYTHNSVKWALTGGKAPYEKAPVTIGDNVYIGPNTIIGMGVAIGGRSIIGAQSLVLSPVPELTAAWGQPAESKGRVIMAADGSDYHIEYDKGRAGFAP